MKKYFFVLVLAFSGLIIFLLMHLHSSFEQNSTKGKNVTCIEKGDTGIFRIEVKIPPTAGVKDTTLLYQEWDGRTTICVGRRYLFGGFEVSNQYGDIIDWEYLSKDTVVADKKFFTNYGVVTRIVRYPDKTP